MTLTGNRVVYQSPNKQLFKSERSTQEANFYMKHAITNRIPIRATLIRVNEASVWNLEWSLMKEMK